MVDQDNQDQVVSALCRVWKELDREPSFLICRPDRWEHGRCDAMVWRRGFVWALEHTFVHTTPQRPFHLGLLQRFGEPIVKALHEEFPHDFFDVRIPVSGIAKLANPSAVAASIVAEASRILPTLRDGTGWVSENAPGVPFTMMVFLGVRTKRDGRVNVGPYGPDDSYALADMRRALVNKREKLAWYAARRVPTVLLLDVPETYAFHDYFWKMFLDLTEEVPHQAYNEVVLAGSSGMPPFFHCLKRDGSLIRHGREYADFIQAQHRVLFGDDDASPSGYALSGSRF